MKSTICIAAAAALAIGFPIILASSAPAKDGDGKIHVSVDDLGKTADLIGRLGKPLGTWGTIQGEWTLPKTVVKDYSLRFTVTHVDGAKLEQPVEFNVAQVSVANSRGENVIPKRENQKQLDGRTWTLKGYETGRFHITPPEYDAAIGAQVRGRPYWISPFTSEIVGILQP